MSDVPSLSRPAFFDGQALTAADLTAVQDYHRDLLWLHQRTLHGSGIASGLAVSGAKGDKAVTVQPGYAIDSAGQSIVLGSPQVLATPAVVGGPTGKPVTYYLTISYVADDDLAAAVRSGTCGADGAVRRLEAPRLRWREPSDIDSGADIVLGAISVLNCKLTAAVDLALRRSALPERQPYLFAGQSSPAATAWALWRPGDASTGDPLGLKVAINTSEAGFANTPKYQVQVVGSREVVRSGDKTPYLLDGYVQVAAASSVGFELRMSLPRGADSRVNPDWALAATELLKLPTQASWYVSWLGVEG